MRALALLLAAVLGAAPAAAQADTVKDFKRLFRKEKDPAVRVEYILSLAGVEDPAMGELLLPLLTDPDPAQAAAALRVLTGLKEPSSRAGLILALEAGKPAEALPFVARAAGEGRWTEFAAPLRAHVAAKDEALRLWTFTALGQLADQESLAVICGAVTADPNPMVRVAAIEAAVRMGEGREELVGPSLVAALRNENLSVAIASCRGLRTVRTAAAIEPLIELFERAESGKLLEEIWPTLVAITDEPFNAEARPWREWWTRVQAGGGYQLLTREELAKRRAARQQANAQYTVPKVETTFMGVETSSRNIVFVIDVSGSMEEIVVNREAFRERGFTDFQKLAVVKEELRRSVETLGDNVRFNIHAFATKTYPWKDRLVPANTLNRRAAMAWISELKPIGGQLAADRASAGLRSSSGLEDGRTNAFAGLLAGLGVEADPQKRGPVTAAATDAKEGEGDTMFFLTDGKPTVGEVVDTEDILVTIRELNRFRKVTIHTIAIGDFTSSFLKQLAEQNGGVFVDLGK
jgi:HEAT repeat protein